MIKIIILPLSSNVSDLLDQLSKNGDEALLDIESVLSFIFYAFSLHSNFNEALQYSIDTFQSDFLLNRPEITAKDVNQTLQTFKTLFIQLYLNLGQYNTKVNEQLPYDFGSFLTESEIILKKSTDFIN